MEDSKRTSEFMGVRMEDKMVFEVTLERAREALKVYIAKNQTGVACVKKSAGAQ